jgi:hypothetical protein
MPMPDNPFDITDEQLKKMSKIISMGLMKNMAFNTTLASSQLPPQLPASSGPPYHIIADKRIAKLESEMAMLVLKIDELQSRMPKQRKTRRTQTQ